jgi:hypothetical protein
MKTIVMVFGLLVSTAAFGNGLAEMNQLERCTAWTTNAMHGATQALRGASRDVQYISRAVLFEMLEHSGGLGSEKIYILADDGYTDEERDFLETSTLFGYDAMSSWKSHNADYGPSRDQWRDNFMAVCMDGDAV